MILCVNKKWNSQLVFVNNMGLVPTPLDNLFGLWAGHKYSYELTRIEVLWTAKLCTSYSINQLCSKNLKSLISLWPLMNNFVANVQINPTFKEIKIFVSLCFRCLKVCSKVCSINIYQVTRLGSNKINITTFVYIPMT